MVFPKSTTYRLVTLSIKDIIKELANQNSFEEAAPFIKLLCNDPAIMGGIQQDLQDVQEDRLE